MKPVISVPTSKTIVEAEPSWCAVIIMIRPGIASTNEPVIVQRRPTISIM